MRNTLALSALDVNGLDLVESIFNQSRAECAINKKLQISNRLYTYYLPCDYSI